MAMEYLDDISDLNFVQFGAGGASNLGAIVFGAYSAFDGSGAYAYFPGTNGGDRSPSALNGDVWLNNTSVSTGPFSFGSYSYFTILHEIGHAIGLPHPGAYNAGIGQVITYANNALYIEDSHQYTVMSYFDETNTGASAGLGYPDTFMLHDFMAIHQLYGTDTDYNAGNTIYGFNVNNSEADTVYDFTANSTPFMTIYDGEGTDTIDLSGYSSGQNITLVEGIFSDVGGFTGNFSIAFGAVIENATGGSGNDTITGNDVDNVLRGNDGADLFFGGLGNDTIFGDEGTDAARFNGDSTDVTITELEDGSLQVAGQSGEIDILHDVEFLTFDDGTFAAGDLLGPEFDMSLTIGQTDTGEYGNRYNGTSDDDGVISATFQSNGTNLILSVNGYDIDRNNEVEVFLNGNSIGFLDAGPNKGLGPTQLNIAVGDQVPGENTLTFQQTGNVTAIWGVTDVLLEEGDPLPDMSLTIGVTDTGEHGNRYNGTSDDDGIVSATFQSNGTDVQLSLNGYDIDTATEVEVFLNGNSIGFLNPGPNKGLSLTTFIIAAGDQLVGENTLTFQKNGNLNSLWGVTDVLVAEVPSAPPAAGMANADVFVFSSFDQGSRYQDDTASWTANDVRTGWKAGENPQPSSNSVNDVLVLPGQFENLLWDEDLFVF